MSNTGTVLPGTAYSGSAGAWIDNDWVTPNNAIDVGGGTASVTHASYDTGDQTYLLYARNFDFSSIPAGATIEGVICKVNTWYAVGTVSMDFLTLLDVSAGTVGTNQCSTKVTLGTATSGTVIKGGTGDTWGNSLTAAWVKNANFGVAMGFIADADNADVFVNYVQLDVYYSSTSTDATVTAVVGTAPAAMPVPTLSSGAAISSALGTASALMPVPVLSSGVDIPGTVATASAAGMAPDVTGEAGRFAKVTWVEFQIPVTGNAGITGATGTADAAALVPTVTSDVSITAELATATAAALVPTVAGDGSITGELATATADAKAPTITGDASIAGELATAQAAMPVPGVSAGVNGSVSAEIGTATAAALVPALSSDVNITGVLATATAEALAPDVSGAGASEVQAVTATATAQGLAPSLSSDVSVTAVTGIATASGQAPSISGDGSVSAACATATSLMPVPALSAGVSVSGEVGTATAQALAPAVTGAGAGDATVQAVVMVALASMLAPSVANTPWHKWRYRPATVDYHGANNVINGTRKRKRY